MLFSTFFIISVLIPFMGTCDFVVPQPHLRQIDLETVLVHWVELTTDNITLLNLSFWSTTSERVEVNIDEFDISFKFVSVTSYQIYSYQLGAKVSGMLNFIIIIIIIFSIYSEKTKTDN